MEITKKRNQTHQTEKGEKNGHWPTENVELKRADRKWPTENGRQDGDGKWLRGETGDKMVDRKRQT